VGEVGSSNAEGFSTSHQSRSDGLGEEGQLRPRSTSRSSAGTSKQIRIPDFGPPTASFGQGGERKDQRHRPQKSNNLPSALDVVDTNPNVDTILQSGSNIPSGGGDDDGDDDGEEDGGDGGDEEHHSSDVSDTGPCNYDVIRIRVLPHKEERRSAQRWPVWHDENMTTFKVLVYVGEPRRITANDWGVTGAEFVNLRDSIAANPRMSIENGQDLIATFELPVTDEDQTLKTVPVKMRFSPNAEACDCTIVFDVTTPMRYADPERILKPKKQTTVFKLEAQPANCEILSSAQKGQFMLHPKEEDPTALALLDYAKWLELDSMSGQLSVKMGDLPKDIGQRTHVFCIMRKNRRGETETFELAIDLVTFSFAYIPDELIKGQALSPAILLASTPDISEELGVSITNIGGLLRYGFKISDNNIEITGTPNVTCPSQCHVITINCHGLSGISVNLLLPEVKIRKPPRLAEQAVMQITSFGLDEKIAEVKTAAGTIYGFEDRGMHRGTLVSKGVDGWYELIMIFGVETKAAIKYVNEDLSSLEEVNVEGLDPETDADIKIYVKDGQLVIEGTPQAHTGMRDLLIDQSQKRFRHRIVTITPQNLAGDGEKVRLIITCRPLKIFWGVAQTYNSKAMPTTVTKLECCKLDLETLIDDHRRLGFDILIWCLDTPRAVIEKAQKDFTSLIGVVKTADIVCYLSGHGYEIRDGSKSFLLVVDKDGSADWDTDSGNVCIQTELEAIAEAADNSTFLLLIIDACRTRAQGKDKASDQALKMKISRYFTQQVLWWATSKERIALEGRQGQMSLFSECLHDALNEVIAGTISELVQFNDLFIVGMPALKTWVHKKVCEQAAATLQRRSTEDVAQRPSMNDTEAREAFTFALPPRPVLPLPDAPSDGTDPRWKTLWKEKKIVHGDMISYIDTTEITGQVQPDGRIGLVVGRIYKYYIDAVAFAKNDNDWASQDLHPESLIHTNSELFARCYLCDRVDPDKVEPLDDLLSSCDTHASAGAVGKATSSSGKGKESYYPQEPHSDQVTGKSKGSELRKRARDENSLAPSKQPMVSDVSMWAEYDVHRTTT